MCRQLYLIFVCQGKTADRDDSDDEFDPRGKASKGKGKAKALPLAELARANPNLHTLNEHHEHLLSASFDLSFNGNPFNGPSSSQVGAGFGYEFDDDFLGGGDVVDLLRDDLGEGWGTPAKKKDE